REVVARDTILRNDSCGSLDKLATRITFFQHPRKTLSLENVAEEILGIACYPAVALGHESSRINRNKLIRAVRLPDTRQAAVAIRELLDQLADWTNINAAVITTVEPDVR